jgi:hypothetical protein
VTEYNPTVEESNTQLAVAVAVSVRSTGLHDNTIPVDGETNGVSVTVPENPPKLVVVTPKDPLDPTFKLSDDGSAVMLKSGVGGVTTRGANAVLSTGVGSPKRVAIAVNVIVVVDVTGPVT